MELIKRSDYYFARFSKLSQIRRIPKNSYLELQTSPTILKWNGSKPVLAKNDHNIIKYFYKTTWNFSSGYWWSYAIRFEIHARRLRALGIAAPVVHDLLHYPEEHCYIVNYAYINGETIHSMAKRGNFMPMKKLPEFIAKLHKLGVYFRDLHLENIIWQDSADFALLDTIRIKFHKKSLNLQQRAHNLAFLLNRHEDQELFKEFGFDKLVQTYLQAAALNTSEIAEFKQNFNQRALHAKL